MKKPDSVRCGNCIFKGFNGDDKMVCRRFPPSALVDTWRGDEKVRIWSYPMINDTIWCGEFRPTDNLTAVEWVEWVRGMGQDEQPAKL